MSIISRAYFMIFYKLFYYFGLTLQAFSMNWLFLYYKAHNRSCLLTNTLYLYLLCSQGTKSLLCTASSNDNVKMSRILRGQLTSLQWRIAVVNRQYLYSFKLILDQVYNDTSMFPNTQSSKNDRTPFYFCLRYVLIV